MITFERFNQYRERILESARSIGLLVWSAPPIELLVAGIVVPSTIALSCWLFQWIGPVFTMLGYLAGVAYVLTAIVKFGYLWTIQRNNKRSIQRAASYPDRRASQTSNRQGDRTAP